MNRSLPKDIYDKLFKKHGQKIKVFLRGSESQGATYDPFRNTGYTKTILNPLFIRVVPRTISANSLIIREMGLTETGALQILIKNSDVEFIRLSEKILVNEKEYYAYNDAVGNRLQIFELAFGYSRILIFRKDS